MSQYVEFGSVTIGATETSLTTNTAGPDVDTTKGWFSAQIDVSALASTDVYRFRVYEKVLTGSSQKLVWDARLTGVQATPIFESPSFMLVHGWDMTIVKVSGTDRSLSWSVRNRGTTEQAFGQSETVTTTEHSMPADAAGPTTQTADGVYQVFVDGAALALADQFQVRIYEKAMSTSTQRVVFESILSQAQLGPVAFPVIELLHGWDATIDKLTGTDRAFEWSIRKLSAAAAAAETTYPVTG
jgi:hypothetical protein